MAKHIHKKFTTEQIQELLQKYINKEVERKYLQAILGIGRDFSETKSVYLANQMYLKIEKTKRV